MNTSADPCASPPPGTLSCYVTTATAVAAAITFSATGAAPTPAEGWTRGELETHVRDEHSTFAWLQEALLAHAGFEIVECEVRAGIYATYACRRA